MSSTEIQERPRTRRDRYRAYIAGLNPSAPVEMAIDKGLVWKGETASLFRKLVAKVDLEPRSKQWVVGGQGAGKTTQLKLAADLITQSIPDSRAVYFDVAEFVDPVAAVPGALLAAVGLKLGPAGHAPGIALSKEGKEAVKRIQAWSFGEEVEVFEPQEPDYDSEADCERDDWSDPHDVSEPGEWRRVRIKGKLASKPLLDHADSKKLAALVAELLSAFRSAKQNVVLLIDGLDRLSSPDLFLKSVVPDLNALHDLECAAVLTGPLHLIFHSGFPTEDRLFSVVHHLPALPVEGGAIEDILCWRDKERVLSEPAIKAVAQGSGGVLRDVVALARDAGEEAYMDLSDSIEERHALLAVDRLGETLLRGLGSDAKKSLTDLQAGRGFDAGDPRNLALLLTRRVVEYSRSELRVHPALARQLGV